MKKIFRNNRLIAIAFFTVFSAGSASVARANDSSYVVPVELKFIGSINNQPLFQLSFAGNPLQDEFTITIRDEEGNPLYKENIKGENFTKKFLVNNDEIGDDTLRFEIICKKTKKIVVYEVDRHTRFLEETLVKEARY
jgi:hypothetical protein